MTNMPSENLEERIERILRKNEEIEKKHREAEEDRLMALKDNAMVEIKPPKDEDWPREHKYDKLDFTYDQKTETPAEESLEAPKEPDTTNSTSTKVKRDYKKFAEGEGPPPDPMYNFLADAERDGKLIMRGENKQQLNLDSTPNAHKKDWKPNQSKGKPGSGGGRGGRQGKNNRSNEYDSWKNEREKIDEERISRQKAGEGKWRREWDNEKDNESSNRSTNNNGQKFINKTNVYDNTNNGNFQQKVHNSDLHVQQPVNLATTYPSNQKNCASNIMVSVSQDANGEVKSVKLTSAPIIGTGRVGPRHIPKTQFQVLNRPESQNQIKKSIDGNKNDRQLPQRSNSLRYEHMTKQPLIKSSSIQDRLKPNICQNNNGGEPLIQSPHNPVFVNN